MRFTPQFLDEIRARLPVSQVVSRKVSLKKAGREFRGLSPFKSERSPSFFVNDQKGFYHCFASGEHGDIFKFVMETEGLSFGEAVERLAGEAGLELPKVQARDPQAQQQTDERTRLYEALEASARFFEEKLAAPEGRDARAYLEKRGLKRETIREFRIGFAPAGRSVLKEALAAKGFRVPDLALSGMLISGDDIPVPYDRFRGRVMFPITDAKSRVIAFGGRALDPSAPAKYLNSPETPLFHKGAILFNAARARAKAFDRGRIVAVEGYMDVISLAEAGFGETVAPLGTALTDQQLQLLWRMSPEPILCFDGDAAGIKAAYRAVETALPLLKPGFSIQFAFLPGGMDPDDLVRTQGPEAFETILKSQTRPLFDVLIEREEASDGGTVTPEQRAALETRLTQLVARIGDATVRGQYEVEMRQTLWERSRREVREITGNGGRRGAAVVGRRRNNAQVDWRVRERARMQGTRGGQRQSAAPAVVASNELTQRSRPVSAREAVILLSILNHPWLAADEAEMIAELKFTTPGLQLLRDALLSYVAEENSLDRSTVHAHLTSLGLAKVIALVERAITHKGDKFADPEADRAAVERGWHHVVALHLKDGLREELAVARQAWDQDESDEAFVRICEIHRQLNTDASSSAEHVSDAVVLPPTRRTGGN
jgi:DNA primase